MTSVFENLVAKYSNRVSIETQTPVLNVKTKESDSEHPYISSTPRGSVSSRHVIHATNGHAAHLLPQLRGKIVPLRGQMSVQRLPGAPNLGSERSWLFKSRREFNYMTQNPASGDYFLGGGTLQSGNGGLEPLGSTADDEQDLLALGYLRKVLGKCLVPGNGADERPNGEASEPSLVSSWTGIMGFSCDDRPWVGRLPSTITERHPICSAHNSCGEWIAAGFCGMGMVNCWRSGRAVASMILDEPPDWFPKSLLPTEERFQRSSTEDMASHWVSVAA